MRNERRKRPIRVQRKLQDMIKEQSNKQNSASQEKGNTDSSQADQQPQDNSKSNQATDLQNQSETSASNEPQNQSLTSASNEPQKQPEASQPSQQQSNENSGVGKLSPLPSDNINQLKKKLGNAFDLTIRELEVEVNQKLSAAILYIEGLVDTQLINEFIVERLLALTPWKSEEPILEKHALHYVKQNGIAVGKVSDVETIEEAIDALLAGMTVFFLEGSNKALQADTIGGNMRGVEEPTTEVVIRGPKEAFTEQIKTNIALVRRKIHSPDLRVEPLVVGEVTKTQIALLYIETIAENQLVEEVKRRIQEISTDGIIESGQLEEFIQDETFTVFPQMVNTERPDVVTGNLLEGRVAIMVNGTPFSLIAPTQFIQFFQSPEDYYMRYDIGTFLRMLRFFVFVISLIAPSIYIALTTFHQDMIPTTLLFGLAAQREGIPFPAVFEALIMEITFEILREAGIRMPRQVGVTLSIVGALVLGQVAVLAGIVSPVMVIVVGITAVASFAVPSFSVATSARLLRFPLMIISSVFGFYGLSLALIVIIAHLTSLRSFGIPYLSPLAPFQQQDLKDSLFRFPAKKMFQRPKMVSGKNPVRMQKYQEKMGRKDGQNQ